MNARRDSLLTIALVPLLLAVLVPAAHGVTQLKRGDAAPAIALRDLLGGEVTLEKFRGRTVVVIFGELYHDKTRQACTQVDAALRDERLEGQTIVTVLIAAHEIKPEHLRQQSGERLPPVVLRDPDRRAFGAYQVAVMPSAVIIDGEGKVVHAVAGLTPRFADLITDSLLFASGKLSLERFQEALNPSPMTADISADVRAERVAQLGRQLARRGLDDMAAEKFNEALTLDPKHTSAHQDLGLLLLKRRRLAEAEQHFRAVLAQEPNSLQASLGLAFVQTLRGGAELDQAERTVRDLLARNPTLPRAHYLMGLISEQRGKPEDAAGSFKRAAQLLLERADAEE